MKKTFIISILLVGLLFGNTGWAQPVFAIDEPIHTFEAVVEGNRIFHTFTIKNTGDTVLKIIDVLPP